MKTTTALNRQFSRTQHETDEQLQDDFDDLVRLATDGDHRALGVIAMVFRSMPLEVARQVFGEDFAHEAEDVLQDFFLMILEEKSRFVPAHGRGIDWMCGIIRSMARRHRIACEMAWGIGDDP